VESRLGLCPRSLRRLGFLEQRFGLCLWDARFGLVEQRFGLRLWDARLGLVEQRVGLCLWGLRRLGLVEPLRPSGFVTAVIFAT
jgi:hypothetical protein